MGLCKSCLSTITKNEFWKSSWCWLAIGRVPHVHPWWQEWTEVHTSHESCPPSFLVPLTGWHFCQRLSSWWWPVPGIGHSCWYLTLGWGISYTWSKDALNSYMSPLVQGQRSPLPMQKTKEMWVPSAGWEDPLEEETATHSSVLAWRVPMDRGAWWATVHGVTKSQTWLSIHSRERGRQKKMTFPAMHLPPHYWPHSRCVCLL